jgi:hypothetical protein
MVQLAAIVEANLTLRQPGRQCRCWWLVRAVMSMFDLASPAMRR